VPDSWAEESYSVVQQISWRIGLVGAAALEAATGVHDTQLVTLGDVLRVRWLAGQARVVTRPRRVSRAASINCAEVAGQRRISLNTRVIRVAPVFWRHTPGWC
jgi:hypothetical protein